MFIQSVCCNNDFKKPEFTGYFLLMYLFRLFIFLFIFIDHVVLYLKVISFAFSLVCKCRLFLFLLIAFVTVLRKLLSVISVRFIYLNSMFKVCVSVNACKKIIKKKK